MSASQPSPTGAMSSAPSWGVQAGGLVMFGEWTVAMVKDDKKTKRDLDVVELWSGVGLIAGAARDIGHEAAEFDIMRIPGHTNVAGPRLEDITTNNGFNKALHLVLRLRPGGLLWMAPLCSSFAFPNSSKCKRTAADFKGDASYYPVEQGNYMAMAAMFFAQVALCRSVHLAIENPAGSTFWSFVKEFSNFLAQLPTHIVDRCAFDDGSFPKMHKRYKISASGTWICKLGGRCACPGQRHQHLMYDAPRGRTGTPLLKESGHYPQRLADRVIHLWGTAGPVLESAMSSAAIASWGTGERSTRSTGAKGSTPTKGTDAGPWACLVGHAQEHVQLAGPWSSSCDSAIGRNGGGDKADKGEGEMACSDEMGDGASKDAHKRLAVVDAHVQKKVKLTGPWVNSGEGEEEVHTTEKNQKQIAKASEKRVSKAKLEMERPREPSGPWSSASSSSPSQTAGHIPQALKPMRPWAEAGL